MSIEQFDALDVEISARTSPPPTMADKVNYGDDLRIDTVHLANQLVAWTLWGSDDLVLQGVAPGRRLPD
jgi:hypothetical protein